MMELRILLVDDDESIRLLLERKLQRSGFAVMHAADGREAIHLILERAPSIVLTDWEMPGMDGLELCRTIRSHEGVGFTFVILMTSHIDREHLVQAFAAGADDFIRKPLDTEEVLARIRAAQRTVRLQEDLASRNRQINLHSAKLEVALNRLQAANIRLHRMATTDELTGLTNRREALTRLGELWATSQRHGEPLSCVMLDIDHFKRFNDTYGHDVGDLVLKHTAQTLKRNTRSGERTCRVGGEEFLLVCPRTAAPAAAIAAERLRTAVESAPLMHRGLRLNLTVSLGVAERTPDMQSIDDLLKAADEALYCAKRDGRNRICRAEDMRRRPSMDDLNPGLTDGAVATGADGPCVLVVDDDPDMRTFCARILARDGMRVVLAADGLEALCRADECNPDVIVMDWHLRRLDGAAALAKLREQPHTRDIPVILMSADDANGRMSLEALEKGADEFLRKPLRCREFTLRVRAMLRLETGRRALVRSNDVRAQQAMALSTLLDFSCELAQAQKLEATCEAIVRVAVVVLRAEHVALLMPDERGDNLRIVQANGISEERIATLRVPMSAADAARAHVTDDDGGVGPEAAAQAVVAVDVLGCGDGPRACRTLLASDSTVAVLHVGRRPGGEAFSPLELECLDMICNIAGPSLADLITCRAKEAAQDCLVVALAKLAEHRDSETGRHLDRVTQFAVLLARELGMTQRYATVITEDFLSALERAVPLHDIGKVAIPDHILRKPGKLTAEEMSVMQTHVVVGSQTIRDILERVPGVQFLQMAEQITACHHEWYNGEGYPDGRRGQQIPLAARIAAVADVYDALTTERVYKKAFSHDRARQIISDGRGTQFDPDVVDAFLRVEGDFARLARLLADDPGGDSPPPPMPVEHEPEPVTLTV